MLRLRVLVAFMFFAACCSVAQLSDSQLHNGSTFVASVENSVRASHAKPGERVEFKVAQAFLLDGEVIPARAKIVGHVVVAHKGDKKSNVHSMLAVVADSVSWKKRSARLSAWIVAFGSRKVSVSRGSENETFRLDPRSRAIMSETTDRPSFANSSRSWAPKEFEASSPSAMMYDPAGFVRDIRIVRKPNPSLGTLLLHDDGDIYLPKGLLVLMEQIELPETSR